MSITKIKWLTRDYIRTNPDKIFLFGDNLRLLGFGGQAKECRGEGNTIGIPTKKLPAMHPAAFFTDDELMENMKAIDAAFSLIPKNANVVIPEAGIGTGLADMPTKCPKTFEYLLAKLKELE